jgi:hypothetical protein
MERKTISEFALRISGAINFANIDMYLQEKVKDQ